MGNQLAIILNSISLACCVFSLIACALLSLKIQSKGMLIMAFAFLWMVPIRLMILTNTITGIEYIETEILAVMPNGFWILMSLAILVLYRDVKRMLE